MNVAVKYKCGSCDKHFTDDYEFESYYSCDDCSEYWLKEDGRQCPQCHKFGRNTEMPVCGDCTYEVEDCDDLCDPDEVDVWSEDGEIVSETKAKKMAKEKMQREDANAKRQALYQERQDLLQSEMAKLGVTRTDGYYTLIARTATILDAEVTVRADIDTNYVYKSDEPPFRLSIRMRVGGDKLNSGWEGYVTEDKAFATMSELVEYATQRMNEPMIFA